MQPVEPIHVVELFQEIHHELLALLNGLHAEDWQRPTVAGAWMVKDIVAHLLDSDIRRLALQRDQAAPVLPDQPIQSYQDLVIFLNQLNADWVRAMRRMSPRLLIEFLAQTGPQVSALFATLDPHSPALFGVAWAGEMVSENWFDIAREYTEKWHHQQQIREAVNTPSLTSRRWLFPVIDTFMRGLPHTYRNVQATDGTQLLFTITGPAGGQWTLQREVGVWRLYAGAGAQPTAEARLDQDCAWRLLTKGLTSVTASERITFTGADKFRAPLLGMLSVMA